LVKPEGARDTRRQRVRQSLNRLISTDSTGVSVAEDHVVFGMVGDF
jgi:hypothetical protein